MTTRFVNRRIFAALAGAAAMAFAAATPAQADEAAEQFIAGVLDDANIVFNAASEEEQFAGIDALVDKYVDMKRVGMFVLGQYARQISDAQKEEYFPLFREYAKDVYRGVLSDYSGERLVVDDSVDRSPRDIIVNTRVADAEAGSRYADMVIHWRVYRSGEDAEMSVFDAGADGVWLAIEQQSQFKSVIANNGGGAAGIDALIADLRSRLAE